MTKFHASGGQLFSNRWLGLVFGSHSLRKFAALASLVFLQGAADAKIIYVNGANTAGGNGTSWSRAFTFLQDALEVTTAGDQIFLAKGTYYPDDGENVFYGDREVSFKLDQVTLYGGFVGTESSIDQRDPKANVTTLSGEIWSGEAGLERYWSLHVVVLNGNATLDGLTLEKGRANGDEAPYSVGGGCYVQAGTLTLVNCVVTNNLAGEAGGGVFGDVVATDTTFSNNVANNEFLLTSNKALHSWLYNPVCSGGAIKGDVTASNCVFSDNRVDAHSLDLGITCSASGGAIAGAVNATDCVFRGNWVTAISDFYNASNADSTARGGAIAGNVSITNCTFESNTADSTATATSGGTTTYVAAPTSLGGAIAGQINAANCAFSKNLTRASAIAGNSGKATSSGGSLYVENTSSLVNCTFTENAASIATASIHKGPALGGALHTAAASFLPVMNSSFLNNRTSGNGAAISCGGSVNVLSNIFWNTADTVDGLNQSKMIHVQGRSRISNRLYPTPSTETKNIVKGGVAAVTKDAGANIDFGEPPERTLLNLDPKFIDMVVPSGADLTWRTADDGLRLDATSPAIAIGNLAFLPADSLDLDEDGNLTEPIPVDAGSYARVQGDTLDLGAYEFGNITHAPDIVVEYPAGNSLVDEVSLVDFGVAPGTVMSKTFVIKNTGPANLNKLVVSMTGPDLLNFSFTQPLRATLNTGDSTTFTVTLKPSEPGIKKATLHVASNDTDESPFDIEVQGETLLPDIFIQEPAGTDLTDGVSLVNYGTVAALSSSTKTFTIGNNGLAKLSVVGITSSGASAKEFKVFGPVQSELAPGETTTFRVVFSPTAAGARNASISVVSSDPDSESPFLINLTGNGTIAPEIAVNQPSSVNVADGATKNFGSVKTGLSYSKTFTIKNVGSSNLKNIAVSLSGSSAFSKSKITLTTLKPGENVKLTVTFKPNSTGDKKAVLKIVSNDADENPFEINLKGAGVSGGSSSASSKLAAVAKSSAVSSSGEPTGVVTEVKASNGLEYLVLTVAKTSDWETSRHTVQVSANLVDWFSGDKHTTTLQDDANVLRVRDNTPVTKGEKRYIRLK